MPESKLAFVNVVTLRPSWDQPQELPTEIVELKRIMRANRMEIERLRQKYPFVWHVDYTLADYAQWIVNLASAPNPTIYDLTVVCLAVRAATDIAEFDWRTRPESNEIDDAIKALLPPVKQALRYVAGRRGLSLEDEQARCLYEEHIKTNQSILEALVSPNITREERSNHAATLREGVPA